MSHRIDGSIAGGGGQLLRTALSLAAIKGEPIHVENIRANRANPGLAPQHLTVVKALAQICQAQVGGDVLGSTEVTFEPTVSPQAGRYVFDVAEHSEHGSAGSVTLLAQALIPPLMMAEGESRLTLHGGTHVRWSPSYEYFAEVYGSIWQQLACRLESELIEWGFYPAGGGQIELSLARNPASLTNSIDLTRRGRLLAVEGRAVAANLPAHIAQRMTDRARNLLSDLDAPFRVTPRRVRSAGPGAGLFLTARYQGASAGFSSHGKLGKPSEQVAAEACQVFLAHHRTGLPVDEHLADQLLLPLCLTAGQSTFLTGTLTTHFKSNAQIIQSLLPEAKILSESMAEGTLVRVTGVQPPSH